MKLYEAPDPEDRDEGWKPDPLGSGKERECDGGKWTGNIRGGSQPGRQKLMIAAAVTGVAVVGVLGFVIGAGSRQTEIDDANTQIASLETDKQDALSDLREYNANWDGLVAEATAEKEKWKRKRQNIRDNTAEMKAIKNDLAGQPNSLDAREKKISSAEAEIENNRFGDGV